MTEIQRGEIRRAVRWHYAGHEASGDRPALVISPDWFNSTGNTVIAPLTTPNPNHENWWKPYIAATNSSCLVPDIRTVPKTALRRNLRGQATPDELEDILQVINRLTNGREEMSDGEYTRGEVWKAHLADTIKETGRPTAEALVLHYNPHNRMAMTILVSTRRRRKLSPATAELYSSPILQERTALISQLRPIAVDHRLANKIGTVSDTEMQLISNKLRDFLSTSAPQAHAATPQPRH